MTRESMLAQILAAIPGNDTGAQRDRLLAAMRELGNVSTFEAMRYLDCYDPRPRILELRQHFSITTVMRRQETESGESHRIGVYVLNPMGRPQ